MMYEQIERMVKTENETQQSFEKRCYERLIRLQVVRDALDDYTKKMQTSGYCYVDINRITRSEQIKRYEKEYGVVINKRENSAVTIYYLIWDYLSHRANSNEEADEQSDRTYIHFLLQKRFAINRYVLLIKDVYCTFSKDRDEWKVDQKNRLIYKENIKVNFITSLSNYITVLNREIEQRDKETELIYRGHGDINYRLIPSLLRYPDYEKQEEYLKRELEIRCPKQFDHCRDETEKMVVMQHYGLPTRLLDFTLNPLVALYFASDSEQSLPGEVMVFRINRSTILYSTTDDNNMREQGVNFIKVKRSNDRIMRQEGLFGVLHSSIDQSEKRAFCDSEFESFRCKKSGSKVILLIRKKDKTRIMNELDMIGINKSFLFPEIECTA